MDRRWIVGVLGFGVSLLLVASTSWAADGDVAAEAATTETAFDQAGHEEILATIEETRKADPELAREMEQQLKLLESGELNLQDLETAERSLAMGAPPTPTETTAGGGLTGGFRGAELLGPPVDTGIGGGAGGGRLPPEARKELEELFKQGTGDPNSEKDRELREKAGEILEKYGVDPREMGTGREGHDGTSREGMNSPREAFEQWERSEQGRSTDPAMVEQYREQAEQYQAEFERGGGFEHALEQMAPEAREQMERHFGEGEHPGREAGERGFEAIERGGQETSGREHEATTREYDAPAREYEVSTREMEAPSREVEATTREYEAPTREYEAATREYEAPTHEVETAVREYEAPTVEYQAPERTYEAPQPYEGSPH